MPVDVTVEYMNTTAVVSFDVMPTFEQLRHCIAADFVKSKKFDMTSKTLRGTTVALKDQKALNRVCSDGSDFTVFVTVPTPGAGGDAALAPSVATPAEASASPARQYGLNSSPTKVPPAPASSEVETSEAVSVVLCARSRLWCAQRFRSVIHVRETSGPTVALVQPSTISNSVECTAMALSGDGVWCGYSDGGVFVFEATSFVQLASFRGQSAAITAIAVAPNDQFVFAASLDGTVRQYDTTTRSLHNILAAEDRDEIRCLTLAAFRNGSRDIFVFAGTNSKRLLGWSAMFSHTTVEVSDAHDDSVAAIATELIDVGAARLWSGGADGKLRLWLLTHDSQADSVALDYLVEFLTHRSAITTVMVLESRTLSASADGLICIFMSGDKEALPTCISQLPTGQASLRLTCGEPKLVQQLWVASDHSIRLTEIPDQVSKACRTPGDTRGLQQASSGLIGAAAHDSMLSTDEAQRRALIELEHDRDFFKLLSLHDTLFRSFFCVPVSDFTEELVGIALASHAQLGINYVQLYTATVSHMAVFFSRMHAEQSRLVSTALDKAHGEVESLRYSLSVAQAQLERAQARCELQDVDIADMKVVKHNADDVIASLEAALAHQRKRGDALEQMLDKAGAVQQVRHAEFEQAFSAQHDEVQRLRELLTLQQEETARERSRADQADKRVVAAQQSAKRALEELVAKERTKQAALVTECEQVVLQTRQDRDVLVDSLQAKVQEQQTILDGMAQRIASLETDRQNAAQQHQNAMRQLKAAHSDAQAKLDDELRALAKRYGDQAQELDQVRLALSTTEIQLSAFRSSVRTTSAALQHSTYSTTLDARDVHEDAWQRTSAPIISKLKGEIAALEGLVDSERARRAGVEEMLTAAEEHYESLQRLRKDDAAKADAALSQERARSAALARELTARIEDLVLEQQAAAARLESLQLQMRDAEQAASGAASTREELRMLRTELELTKSSLEALQCQRHEMTHARECDQRMVSEATARLVADHANQLRELHAELEAKQQSAMAAQAALQDATSEHSRLQKASDARHAEMVHALETHRTALRNAEDALAAAQVELRVERAERAKAEESHRAAAAMSSEQLMAANRATQDLHASWSAARAAENAQLAEEVQGLRDSLKLAVDNHEQYVKESEEDRAGIVAKLSELRDEVDLQAVRAANFDQELAEAKRREEQILRELASANDRERAAAREADSQRAELELQLEHAEHSRQTERREVQRLQELLQRRDAELEEEQRQNEKTMSLLEAAQTALQRAATQTPDSLPSSPMSTTVNHTNLVLSQISSRFSNDVVEVLMPLVLAKSLLLVDAAAAHSVAALSAAASRESLLTRERDQLLQSMQNKNSVLAEAQLELRTLYARYRAESEELAKTRGAASSRQAAVDEVQRLRQALERNRQAHAESRSGGQAEDPRLKPIIIEILDGLRDAVALLLPLSLSPRSMPSEGTLVALYEWLVSTQMRCEAVALSVPA